VTSGGGGRGGLRGSDHPGRAIAAGGEPPEQLVGVADRRRQGDALQLPAGQPADPGEDGEEVPSPVVAGEGVDLVDDRHPQVGEPAFVVDARGDEHGFERFGGGEQHVGWLGEQRPSRGGSDVAVPQTAAPAHQVCVTLQSRMQVVEQGP